MGEITVVSLSGIYAHEGFHRNREGLRFIDCTDVRGTNGYCDAQAKEVLRERLGESHPLHFIDHGNYHYLSKLYTDMITEPFHLVVFDHHTDMQEPAFGGLLSCGSWVKEVMETNEYVEGVTIVGAGCGAESESWGTGTMTHFKNHVGQVSVSAEKRVIVPVPADSLSVPSCHLSAWPWEMAGAVSSPIYISIDKDVLSPTEVLTNWDQGEMTADALFAQLDELCAHHRILGIDVCGDAAPDMDPSILKRAVSMNDALNERFLNWYMT